MDLAPSDRRDARRFRAYELKQKGQQQTSRCRGPRRERRGRQPVDEVSG